MIHTVYIFGQWVLSTFCLLYELFIPFWFSVVFCDEVTKILRYSLFVFHFILPILPCKRKTLYRKSCNLSDEKPKTELPNMWWAKPMSRNKVILPIRAELINFLFVTWKKKMRLRFYDLFQLSWDAYILSLLS